MNVYIFLYDRECLFRRRTEAFGSTKYGLDQQCTTEEKGQMWKWGEREALYLYHAVYNDSLMQAQPRSDRGK